PPAGREPTGGWIAPLEVVEVVALLASGVPSSDPEPEAAVGPTAVPVLAPAAPASQVSPPAAAGDPAAVPATDDQADSAEFGFDSQLGVLAPRGEPAASVPAAHPGEGRRPAR